MAPYAQPMVVGCVGEAVVEGGYCAGALIRRE